MFGASPDYLCADGAGLVEIKCPTSRTHYRSVVESEVSEDYELQMLAQLACTGRQYVDFVSFDPRFPYEKQFWSKRYARVEAEISGLEMEIEQFLCEVEKQCRTSNSLMAAPKVEARGLVVTRGK